MLKVGITGGIGSGKTTVCQLFELLGIPVYYADIRAKAIMTEDPELIEAIKEKFGEKAYSPEGQLDKKYIASIVFNDSEKLALLNSLVHPAVFRDAENWQKQQQGVPYTIKEAALAFESGSYKKMDKMITVYAPEPLRIERVITRDNSTIEAVKARMDKQMPEIEKMKKSHFIIINDNHNSLIQQVIKIHNILIEIDGKNEK